jgi:hypothetical protein
VSEADLIDHNRLYPDHKMVSVTPSEGTSAFEFSLVNVATDPAPCRRRRAAWVRSGSDPAPTPRPSRPPPTSGSRRRPTDLLHRQGGKGQDRRELAPIGRLDDDSHRAVVATAASTLAKDLGGGTGLYDTIWAAHQKVSQQYDPGRVNAVVILTDGRNEDPKGISLEQLKANLRAASDPTKPIAITTIGIGPNVDPEALSQISGMSCCDFHAAFHAAPSPADMTTVLARALFDHECKDGRCV